MRTPSKSDRLHVELSEEYVRLLSELEEQTGLNRSRLTRAMIDVVSKKLGLKPVGTIPKFLAPTS